MADAAKAARGSFKDIKQGAQEMGESTRGSMMEARHGVMLLGEEFGIHLPRALTSFIASIGPVGAAMQAAFPFLAIIVGATLLLEHLSKLKEQGAELTESQAKFGTTVANVLNGLDDKLLQAGIRTDELNHNHLGALEKQLQLIDHQSMSELERSFDAVAKAADVSFATLKTAWYSWSAGSAGAKHALEDFKAEYDALLTSGDTTGAANKLKGTLEQAKAYLAEMRQSKGTLAGDDKQLQSQENFVAALQATAQLQQKINDLKTSEKANATTVTQNKMADDGDKVAREQAQEQKRAMDEAQKLWEENYRTAVAALQESEREKIDATDQGSAARLAAIDAAIKEENSKGLQETGFYRGLLTARVQVTRQMAAEEDKVRAEAGKLAAEHDLKMADLAIAAEREKGQLRSALAISTGNERLAAALQIANEEYQQQQQAYQKEIAALNQHASDYENKKRALQNKEEELEREHQNRIQQIQDQAAQQQYSRLTSAEQKVAQEFSRGFSQVVEGKMGFAKMMQQIDSQVLTGMLQNAMMSMMTLDMTKEKEAAAAARKAYLAGMQLPAPANMIIAPAWAALAFASEMAFAEGGIVPGVGKGDIVPARLEPGEGVLSKKVMEGLTNRAKFGDSGSGGDTHVHIHHSPTIHALDRDGVQEVLTKHADTFERHFHSTLRKMNK